MSQPLPAEPRRAARLPERGWVGGVCAGLAEYLGVDANLVRIGMVLAAVLLPFGLGIYLLLWLVLPYGSDGPTGFDSLKTQFGR